MKKHGYLFICLLCSSFAIAAGLDSKKQIKKEIVTHAISDSLLDKLEFNSIIDYSEAIKFLLFPKEKNTASEYEVASIIGNINVTASGSASYSIPIDLPSAAGHLAPTLALAYGSYIGNGAMGVGFKLEGVSMISRTGNNKHYDGKYVPITYIDTEDNFMLDGQRLIRKGTDSFFLESNPTLIVHQNSDGFWYTGTNGVVYEYFFKATVSIPTYNQQFLKSANGAARNFTFAYSLSKVKDVKGNSIVYSYQQNDCGEILLSQIEYSGKDGRFTNKVQFVYSPRQDVISSWIWGKELKQKSLLTKISVSTEGKQYTAYEMSYENSELYGSFLREVSKTTRDGKKICPVYFAWGVPMQQSIKDTGLSFKEKTSKDQTVIADFNGDGRDDIAENSGSSSTIYYSTAEGTFVKDKNMDQMGNELDLPRLENRNWEYFARDLNGDGKDDLMRICSWFELDKKKKFYSKTLQGVTVYLSSANGTFDNTPTLFLDPNKSGKEIQYNSISPTLTNKVESEAGKKTVPNHSVYNMLPSVLDINDLNNDGVAEFVVLSPKYSSTEIKSNTPKPSGEWEHKFIGTYIKVYSLRSGSFQIVDSCRTTLTKEFTNLQLSCMDINNDGKDEIVLNNGETYGLNSANKLILEANLPPLLNGKTENYTGDANIKSFILETSSCLLCHQYKLVSLSPDLKNIVELGFDNHANYLGTVDLNGDGKKEIITLGEPVYAPSKKLELPRNTEKLLPELIYSGNEVQVKSFKDGQWVVECTLGTIKIPKMINSERYGSTPSGLSVVAKDVNGDGLDDVLLYWSKYALRDERGETIIHSTNEVCSIYLGCPTLANCHLMRSDRIGSNVLLDIDGDGVSELYDYKSGKLEDLNYSKKSLLLSGVMDGFNRVAKFKYGFLADSTVYTKDATATTYPLSSPVLPLAVVRELSISNGIGGENLTTYKYGGLRLHNEGRGLLGFTSFSTFSPAAKQEAVATYDIFADKYVMYPKQLTVKVDGNLASVQTNSYTLVHESGKNGYLLRQDGVENRDMVKGTTSTIRYGGYNEWEMPTSVTSSAGDGWSTEETTTYATATQNKLLPAQKVETRRYGGKSSVATTAYTYTGDDLVKVDVVTDGKSVTKTMQYDDFGNVSQETVDGVTKSYTYDATGRFVTTETSPGDYVMAYGYDSFGNMISKKDPNGFETKMGYSGMGVLVRTELPDGNVATSTVSWSSDPSSVYTVTVKKSGEADVISYFDMFGREVKSVCRGLNGEVVSSVSYNELGQKVSSVAPHYLTEPVSSTSYGYDAYGRLTSERGPTISKTYSYSGKSVEIADYLLGFTVSKEYDAAGKLKKSSDLGAITYDYTPNGSLSKVGAFGSTWQMEYDGLGNRVKLSDPNAGAVTTQYNSKGQMESNSTAIGSSSYRYDAIGRPTAVSNGEFDITYSYDRQLRGLVDEVRGNGTAQAYTYDSQGRVILYKETILGKIFEFAYSYDSYGRVKTLTYPNGFALGYSYNSDGDMVQVKDVQSSGGFICQLVEQTALGMAKRVQLGNGLEVKKEVNERGQITSILDGKLEQVYTYDSGKLLQLTGRTHRYETGKYEQCEQFTYDLYNRLTGVEGSRNETFRYADNGNMVNRSSVGDYIYDGGRPHALAHVKRPAEADTSTISALAQDITYTAFGKVKSITEGKVAMEFLYGPDGDLKVETLKRAGQVVRVRYRVGKLYEVVQEPGKADRVVCYVEGVDGLAAAQVTEPGKEPALYYIHKDHLGSVMQLTDTKGNVVETRNYDAWGSPRDPKTGALLNEIRWLVNRGYTGHEHLPEFKLVNMQGRLYDPVLCRFLSPDPYVQEPENSQSYNRYSYCLNNPMVYSDPSGLMSNLEWAIRVALRNGRNDVYWNGFYMNFGFTGWGNSPNFGDIYRGLFNGSTVINITANYVSSGAGSSSGSDARSAFGSAAPKLIDGPVCRLTGFSVNVVKVEGAAQSNWNGKLYSTTQAVEHEQPIPTLFGKVTIKKYHSKTIGRGPINTSTNQKMQTTVSTTVPLILLNPTISSDGIMIQGPKLGIPYYPTLYTGFSINNGFTFGGEYVDNKGITHGISNSFMPNCATTTIIIGVGVFVFTGIPAFAY